VTQPPGGTSSHTAGSAADAGAFVRDRSTVLSYAAIGGYAFWLYAFGPALALLRAELHFSYAMVGVYSAVWAAGAAVVGVSFTWASRAFGRRAVLWWSALGAVGGAALFAIAHSVALTLAGAAVLGLAGIMVLTAAQSVLSDRHGPRRDRALVEANIGAAACAVAAPLTLGLLQGTPATWRAGMTLPAVVFAVLFLVYRRQPLAAPAAGPVTGRRPAGLPLACWLLALLVAMGIAIEFCIVYFGAELLTATSGLSTAAAATAMAVFYTGILAGRTGAGVLMRRPRHTAGLLWASLAMTTAGFTAFWLSSHAVALAGLFAAGLGVANLFPLALSLTLAAAPGHTDAANARTQLLGGLTVIVAPFLLGSVADHVGLLAAFSVVPLLIALSGLLLLAAQAARHRGGGRR